MRQFLTKVDNDGIPIKKVFQHVSLEFKWTWFWRNESWSTKQHQRRSDFTATGIREQSAAASSLSWSRSSVSLSDKRNHHQDLHHIFLMDGHNQDSSESYSYESIVRVSILSLLFTLATSGKLGNQTSRSNDWSKSVPLSDSWTEAMGNRNKEGTWVRSNFQATVSPCTHSFVAKILVFAGIW